MRTKSFQIAVAAAFLVVFSARFATAKDNSPAHLDRDHVAPVTALEEALTLVSPSAKSAVSDAELDIFKKVAAGDLKSIKESDAILTAANITDEPSRKRYATKLDNITESARKVIADAKTPEEKADKLANFLFKAPLYGGFEDNQVEMKKLLDQGKFNCVSSCVLYNLVGRRLGLKTRAVTGPAHVFLRMGDWYIEPVSGQSCDAKTHEQVVDRLWAQASDVWKTVFGNTRVYQSGNLGLIGEIYLDRSGKCMAEKRNEEAAINVLKAACLDPKHPVFAYQVEQTIRNWFNDTLKQKNYAKAQKIAAIYGQLLGDDSNKLFQQVAAARNARVVAKS
jgi:regulator of sirC expression with transglutaminase-like and TPR domain